MNIMTQKMFEMEEDEYGAILKYIGPEYIIKKDDKYLLRIQRDAHLNRINVKFTANKKFALRVRPKAAGGHIGDYSAEEIQRIFGDDIEIIEL